MTHVARALVFALLSPLALAQTSQPASRPANDPATRPVATAKSPVGDLLRKWWAEGTAAGNVGDIYDNRDRAHSELDPNLFPQLAKLGYSKEQLEARIDWAAQQRVLPRTVFGNSSTSAPILGGGSNIRRYYSHPRGLPFLYAQYTRNNLYIYPEHQDHDPGHNGLLPDGSPGGGYGDVFAANTPYLIASQGSSGSDQPFMRAVPATLAAFRPEVKKKLVQEGLLMPTVQMILRTSMKNLKQPGDYFKPIAHPTVFEGSNVDDLKMAQAAHAITLDTIPPMTQLEVKEESTFENGKDFFDLPGVTEKLADTRSAIARVWRAAAKTRRIVVSAEKSYDVNNRPLEFRWAVLRGADRTVTIKPLNDAKSVVEITIHHFTRFPVTPNAPIESNRVDVGAFVGNGANWSAPAFVTVFSIDSESRTYDDQGRVAEIGYGVGGSHAKVASWTALLDALAAEKPTPGVALLKTLLKPAEVDALGKLAPAYKEKSASKDSKVAQEARDLIEKAQPGLATPANKLIPATLQRLVNSQGFLAELQPQLKAAIEADPAVAAKYDRARTRLIKAGLAIAPSPETKDGANALANLQADAALAGKKLTGYELSELRRFHGEILAQVLLPGVASASEYTNYVDPLVARPKKWRDVYRYDEKGQPAGWTRHGLDKVYEFDAKGEVVVENGADGKAAKTAAVRYEQEQPKGQQMGPNWNALKMVVEPAK